ncbi:VasL domain-containing protein [Buttiauxella brennerae]|uniref:VasL domain-containing protein n=1 Tax=Buttiauxella brennerae TaxID=82988 RepID=UPI00286F67FB|nr:VasL domain-containing protein [Buttiauxella brennerae]
MNDKNSHTLKTGGDPRTLADFAALREEMSKLAHPARPDVDWQLVETLCLNLFERNGVELQTAAWYTQARTRLAGLYGLNEGLAIIVALITHQWGVFWPQVTHARMEILSGLSQRVQQMLRTFTLDYADLSALYQAEKLLTELGDVLQRLELKHLSQMDALRNQLHAAAVRLENSDAAVGSSDVATPGIVLPASASPVPVNDSSRTTWVYVAQTEPQVRVETITVPVKTKPWKPFIAGIVTMLVVGGGALAGWNYLHQPNPELAELQASIAPLPEALSAAQMQRLQRQKPEWLSGDAYPEAVQQRLKQLATLPPDWALNYGNQLVGQVQTLWPQTPMALQMATHWQQQLNDLAMPSHSLNDWHQGMEQLQQLQNRLNGLDEQHGKYMTVSELKTAVFSIQQSFNKTIPVEEQLRQLNETPASALTSQTEMHLNQLLNRYALIKQQVQ